MLQSKSKGLELVEELLLYPGNLTRDRLAAYVQELERHNRMMAHTFKYVTSAMPYLTGCENWTVDGIFPTQEFRDWLIPWIDRLVEGYLENEDRKQADMATLRRAIRKTRGSE